MVRVAILGATGYSGEELIRLLLRHPQVRLTALGSSGTKQDGPVPIAELYPEFAGRLDLSCERLEPERVIDAADAVFLALPHGMALELAPRLLAAGKLVIDLSGDFRLRDPALYPRWYHLTHTQPTLLAQAAYGLPELHRAQIQRANLIANPGCYPTATILGCWPLVKAGWAREFIVDAKSGLTGAGRQAATPFLFAEASENIRAYKVHEHQHIPEMEQELSSNGTAVGLTFVPHVLPLARGILATIYARLAQPKTPEQVQQLFTDAYAREPFVRVRPHGQLPQIRDVARTNYCDIGCALAADGRALVVISVIDNLTKGAAGQAVQNLNIRQGWDEGLGLR